MHTSFARISQMITCMYFGFCHAQYMHTHVSTKKHTHSRKHVHARESSSPTLLNVLQIRFVDEINPALLSAL